MVWERGKKWSGKEEEGGRGRWRVGKRKGDEEQAD